MSNEATLLMMTVMKHVNDNGHMHLHHGKNARARSVRKSCNYSGEVGEKDT